MPNFLIRPSAGFVLTPWDDHETLGTGVSRINPVAARPTRYLKATIGVMVEISAIVDGSEGPLDTGLGGDLFSSDFGEHPCPGPIGATEFAPGSTSIQQFTPTVLGHYLWVMRRTNGGAIGVHFDCEP